MGKGRRVIPLEAKERYAKLRVEGYSLQRAADAIGIHVATARAWDAKFGITPLIQQANITAKVQQAAAGGGLQNARNAEDSLAVMADVPPPLPFEALRPEALRGLEDVGYFAERYFGAILLPFHRINVDKIMELYETPWEEFLVTNIAPGAGKSLFKRVVAAWLIVHDRTSRGLFGSATRDLAIKDVGALRNALERTTPSQPSRAARKAGYAVDATGALCMDYGRFKPSTDERNVWREDGFRVAQLGGQVVADKELTVIAVGFETSYIGTRLNWSFWDDPHGKSEMRTQEGREKRDELWEDVAEARLDTGGILWVIQQRLGQGDLTSSVTAQTVAYDDEDGNPGEERPVYHQIKFRAHYEEICTGDHGPDAKPWPDGCLLFPKKLHWRLLQARQRRSNYHVVYQQEDVNPSETLVKAVWVSGGRDPDSGEEHTGCWDDSRGVCEVPQGLVAPFFSVVTIDPSPTRFWAIQWWVFDPKTENRYLVDMERRTLNADELIDRDFATGEFTGLMPGWQERSVQVGMPITHWIYERNAAQRFILKFNHVQDWQRQNSVSILSHDTHAANKNAPEEAYGLWCVGPHWRFGRVRLPGKQGAGRHKVQQLVQEALAYPNGTTDDCVVAQWIFEWNLPKLVSPSVEHATYDRPGFVPGRWDPKKALKVVA